MKTLAFNGAAATIPPADCTPSSRPTGPRSPMGSKLPASYGREVETKDKDGKTVKTLAFNGMAATMSPMELHAVLSAYGR